MTLPSKRHASSIVILAVAGSGRCEAQRSLLVRRRVLGRATQRARLFEFRDPRSQARNLVQQAAERARYRVRNVAANRIGLKHRLAVRRRPPAGDLPRRVADHRGAVGNFAEDDGGRADAGALADAERSKYLRVRTDNNAVAEGRMTLFLTQRGPAERHALIKRAVVADFGGLADNNPHAMINEYAAADASAGVNFNPSQHPADVRSEPPCQKPTSLPQEMSEAMPDQGVEPGIAQHHFEAGPGGGIPSQSGVYFFPQGFQKHRNPYLC